ncbi:hypothetical protein FOXB_07453 [Fusarium oxysporum f. sp. conglutinans Fo5176]|uniref:Uncharacterized protein n=2 Tax=Fusarium oxysporum f. sp. conglutinans TaxID=100902 RepID=F9FM23_FUSOF|nr:hypothetical protein FOXB_07453 [Fusarium oxysporum f. sp. conglutinans Fo5176]
MAVPLFTFAATVCRFVADRRCLHTEMMTIRDFFQSRFFEQQWKNKVSIAQISMITIAFCLGIAKLATKPGHIPTNRSDIMVITMSIKSYVFLAYEFATQKMDKFRRFGSHKANTVLNTVDIVFWMVVMGLAFTVVSQICVGVNCGIGILVGLAALLVAFVNFWAAVIAWKDHRYFKSYGVRRGQSAPQIKRTYTSSNGLHHHQRYHSRGQNH